MEEALEVHDSNVDAPDRRLRKHLRAAVIQAFEFTYELSFKMLRRHLALTAANPAVIDEMAFNDVIREGLRRGLVTSGIPSWRQYRSHRGAASLAYSEDKAQEVFESVPDFLEEAKEILRRLRRRNTSVGEHR